VGGGNFLIESDAGKQDKVRLGERNPSFTAMALPISDLRF